MAAVQEDHQIYQAMPHLKRARQAPAMADYHHQWMAIRALHQEVVVGAATR